MGIPDELARKAKGIAEIGRKAGRVLPGDKAFEMHPVEEEDHKGRIEYWTDPEGWDRGDYEDKE